MRLPGERGKLALADEQGFLDFVKLCFAHKRKTLVNNLRALAEPGQLRAILEPRSVRVDARAEQLNVAELASLFASLGAPRVAPA